MACRGDIVHYSGQVAFKMKGRPLQPRTFKKEFECPSCGRRVEIEKRSALRPYCVFTGVAFVRSVLDTPVMVNVENLLRLRDGRPNPIVERVTYSAPKSSIYNEPTREPVNRFTAKATWGIS